MIYAVFVERIEARTVEEKGVKSRCWKEGS
jgi:hypothetical protein